MATATLRKVYYLVFQLSWLVSRVLVTVGRLNNSFSLLSIVTRFFGIVKQIKVPKMKAPLINAAKSNPKGHEFSSHASRKASTLLSGSAFGAPLPDTCATDTDAWLAFASA